MDNLYSADDRRAMDARASAAAKREFEQDPNHKDPENTQDRITAATHKLRVQMGLEKR